MMRRNNAAGVTMSMTEDFLRTAQLQAERAAAGLTGCDSAISKLAGAGRRLTELSHRCADGLLNQSIASARGALADGVDRLRTASRADSWGALYRSQLNATAASQHRIASELTATLRILADAGREFGTLARDTARELLSSAQSPQDDAQL